LFIETKNSYFDPDRFRLHLNNCIQTLRTVTFILQKNKRHFTNFESWYGVKQEEMRADPKMKWLNEARTAIVKEGDLETLSLVRASIVESWLGAPILEMQIPPLTKTEEIADFLAKKVSNKEMLKVGLLRVERRWVDSKLPDYELLESLAYVFENLNKLLLDAHINLLSEEERSNCSWFTHIKGKPSPCMLAQDWDRTIWVNFHTGELCTSAEFVKTLSEDDRRKTIERYPTLPGFSKALKSARTLQDEAETVFEQAKNVLLTDGYHQSMVILGFPDGRKECKALMMRDRAEKHLIFHKIAADVEKKGITSLILINEVWMAPREGWPTKYLHAEDAPNRKEALQVMAADTTCKVASYLILFEKDKDGNVHLGKEGKVTEEAANILAPILKVWRKQNANRKP